MIGIFIFIAVVFVWDGIKKSLRGPKIPTISIRKIKIMKAKCGCLTQDHKIARTCAAHELMIKF